MSEQHKGLADAAPEMFRLLLDAVKYLPRDDDTVCGFIDDARALLKRIEAVERVTPGGER